jgi:hypothetical protein
MKEVPNECGQRRGDLGDDAKHIVDGRCLLGGEDVLRQWRITSCAGLSVPIVPGNMPHVECCRTRSHSRSNVADTFRYPA